MSRSASTAAPESGARIVLTDNGNLYCEGAWTLQQLAELEHQIASPLVFRDGDEILIQSRCPDATQASPRSCEEVREFARKKNHRPIILIGARRRSAEFKHGSRKPTASSSKSLLKP